MEGLAGDKVKDFQYIENVASAKYTFLKTAPEYYLPKTGFSIF